MRLVWTPALAAAVILPICVQQPGPALGATVLAYAATKLAPIAQGWLRRLTAAGRVVVRKVAPR